MFCAHGSQLPHIVHIVANPSSSPYCAHGSQFEFKFTPVILKKGKKGLWYNITSKVLFVMFVLSAFACLLIGNLNFLINFAFGTDG
jgi:hypothetical protein